MILPFCVWQSVSDIVARFMHAAGISYVTRQPFSALRWQRVNQYGCTIRSSNWNFKKERKRIKICRINVDRTIIHGLQLQVFEYFLHVHAVLHLYLVSPLMTLTGRSRFDSSGHFIIKRGFHCSMQGVCIREYTRCMHYTVYKVYALERGEAKAGYGMATPFQFLDLPRHISSA